VVESQGFRAASEHLNMSQPAISAHIQALEKQLQTVLLERGRLTKVTDAGAIFYKFAKETLERAARVSHEIEELRSAKSGRIAVASGVTVGRYILPQIFSEFKRENPDVDMLLRIGIQQKIREMVLNREIDIGFIVDNASFKEFVSTTITRIELVFVVGPHHPLASRETVFPEELSDFPFILPANHLEAQTIQKIFENENITVKSTLLTSEDPETNKKFVKESNGISVMLITSAYDDLVEGKLKKLRLTFEPYFVKLRLISHPEKHFSPIQRKFIKYCTAKIPQLKCHQFN
jgi:DNA-binding transcriptional LysR family regulator